MGPGDLDGRHDVCFLPLEALAQASSSQSDKLFEPRQAAPRSSGGIAIAPVTRCGRNAADDVSQLRRLGSSVEGNWYGSKSPDLPTICAGVVQFATSETAGTIIVDTANTYLYLVLGNGEAVRYGISVGRDGFTWSGRERMSRKAEWPD